MQIYQLQFICASEFSQVFARECSQLPPVHHTEPTERDLSIRKRDESLRRLEQLTSSLRPNARVQSDCARSSCGRRSTRARYGVGVNSQALSGIEFTPGRICNR